MTHKQKQPQEFTAFPHLSHEHLQSLMKCYSACSSCAKMCIEEGHKRTAIICNECADICSLAIKFHSSDSEFNSQVLHLCSEICTKCAEECSKMKADHCQQCSAICLACAEGCSQAE